MSARSGVGQALADLLGDLSAMALAHLRLAAREAGDQGRHAAGLLAGVAIGLLLAQAGLLLAAAGIGLLLGRWLGNPAWGLGVIGLILALVGVGFAWSARRRLADIRPMAETLEELEESRRWLHEEALPTLRDGERS